MNNIIHKKQIISYIIILSIPLLLIGCIPNNRHAISLKERLESISKTNKISEKDLYIRALIRMELLDYQGAIKDFNKLKVINPNINEYFLYSGIANQKHGDYRQAIKDYNKAIISSQNKDDKELNYFKRGDLYWKLMQYNKAKQDFDNAIKINNDDMDTFYKRSNIKYLMGDTRGAIKDLDKALELNNKSADSYHNRGSLKFSEGNIIGSLKDFNLAIKYNNNSSITYYNRSIAKYKLNKKKSACLDLNKSIKLGYEVLEKYHKIICSISK